METFIVLLASVAALLVIVRRSPPSRVASLLPAYQPGTGMSYINSVIPNGGSHNDSGKLYVSDLCVRYGSLCDLYPAV